MSGIIQPPPEFLVYNSQQSKLLAVVVEIPGLDYLTSTPVGRNIVYGDPFKYGDPGLLYGSLVPLGAIPGERKQRNLISLDGGSITISQRLEPEQGRASISTLQMTFIDKDQYMTQAVSPGIIIPEILGQEVKVWLGYAQTSFPGDYYLVWRGRVAQTVPEIGRVSMQFTDPNIIRRQQIFTMGQTTLFGAIDNTQTTIPVASNGDFAERILGPDGTTYDPSVKCYAQIEDEFIEYQQTGHESDGFGVNQFLHVVRGARGTTPAAHADTTQVNGFVELSGHACDLALKIMLSGLGGPYKTGQTIAALAVTGNPSQPVIPSAIILSFNIDAVRDLGLSVGDWITVSGATNPGNDVVCQVTGFQDFGGQTNKFIFTTATFTNESSSPALLDLRSQWDSLPLSMGCGLPGQEVDVAQFVYYKDTFLNNVANSYRFLLSSSNTGAGKEFIDSQIMLPIGAYSLTRQGKASMGLTKPPLADQRTTTLNAKNVINPQSIKITRGLNNRKFFNEIDWSYDYDDLGNPASVRDSLNTDSLNLIGISSVLPIDSQGARTDLDFNLIVENRERFLFLRYANASILLDIQTNFGTGNQIEAGDVLIVSDNGGLQIPNLSTGKRDFGNQLMEVINRSLDLKTGVTQLQLEGGVGALFNDRYATISPSSILDAASTASQLVLTDSFGPIFPGAEYKKWQDYLGLVVHVHSLDYTARNGSTIFTGFNATNPYAMQLNPPLGFTPQAGDIVEISSYPNNTNVNDQALYKLVHAYLDPSVAVASGTSNTVFDVGSGDIAKFMEGQTILIHNANYSSLSPEVEIVSIVGNQITVTSSLGFTPTNVMTVELIGFPDGQGPYRLI